MDQQQLYDSAFAQHLQGDLHNAETAYQTLLTINPEHILAKHNLGLCRYRLGDVQVGIALIEAALLAEPNASRYNDFGNLLVEIGDMDAAIKAFRQSVQINSDDAVVWNNLASVLHRQQQLDAALLAYRHALNLDSNYLPTLNNLAQLLSELGLVEEASHYICLAYIQPPLSDKPLKILAFAYFRLGLVKEATQCYRDWLVLEPNNGYAQLHLAACTGENVPSQMPKAYVAELFDEMSDFFENKLLNALEYSGPKVITELLDGFLNSTDSLNILDAGCGTGLIGQVVKPYAKNLVGVDISTGMLAKAQEKAIYDQLVAAELSTYLSECQQVFDLIVMADTIIYFGDVAKLFYQLAQRLAVGGVFVFTYEQHGEAQHQLLDYYLSPIGRYSHNKDNLMALLEANGFDNAYYQEIVIRKEFGKAIMGGAIRAEIKRPI